MRWVVSNILCCKPVLSKWSSNHLRWGYSTKAINELDSLLSNLLHRSFKNGVQRYYVCRIILLWDILVRINYEFVTSITLIILSVKCNLITSLI